MSEVKRINEIAAQIAAAEKAAVAIPQIAAAAGLTLADAYAVQLAGLGLRRERGEEVTGLKLGFTSKEKAEQMGVSDVILGYLTAPMEVAEAGTFSLEGLIHPRIEPEVAFLVGPDGSVTHAAPALEVIDSRFENFSFSLADVVADNTSAARYVLGQWVPLGEVAAALADLAVTVTIDGEVVATGSTGAILGDPLRAPEAITRLAASYGHRVVPGAIQLAGAATAAVPLAAGVTVTATVAGLGAVTVHTAA